MRHRSNNFRIGSDNDKSNLAAADFFLSLSNPTSLMILSIVRKTEMSSGEISKKLGIEHETAVIKLNAMERQGILASRIRSQKTIYRVADLKILKAFDRILEFPAKRLKHDIRYKVKAAKTAVQESSPKQKQSKPGKSPLVQNR